MEKKIPLVVIRILNSLNKHNDKVAGKLNTDAKKAFMKSNLHYIDIYSAINKDLKKYFNEDKYHLSQEYDATTIYDFEPNLQDLEFFSNAQ